MSSTRQRALDPLNLLRPGRPSPRNGLASLAMSLVLVTVASLVVGAQGAVDPAFQWRVLQRSDGVLYVYKDGVKYWLQPADASDEQIATIPESGPAIQRIDSFVNPPAPSPPPPPPPPAITPPGSTLQVGDTWRGQDLTLLLKGEARSEPQRFSCAADNPVCLYDVEVDFSVENRTPDTLNFEVPQRAFFIELSNGRRLSDTRGTTTIVFNDFQSGTKRDFTIRVNFQWIQFQVLKRDPSLTHYIVGVDGFSPRLPEARWRVEIPR